MNQTIPTNAGPRTLTLPVADPDKRKDFLDYYNQHDEKTQWTSNSKATCFLRCPFKFLLRHKLHLKPIGFGGSATALDYGTAMHKAIPVVLSGGSPADAYAEFLSLWTDTHDAIGDPKRNKIVAAAAISKFANDRKNSPYTLEKPPQGVQAPVPNPEDRSPWELRFAIMLPGTSIPFTGFTDGVGRSKNPTDKYLVVPEFKTTSQMGATFHNSFKINSQLIGYGVAIQVLYQEPVKEAYVEGVQSAKTKQENCQIPVPITQNLMAEWTVMMSWVSQNIESMENEKFFPKNLAACSPYPMFGSHGYACEYAPLCKADNFRDFLPMYNIVTDDPYDLSRKIDSSSDE